MPFLKTDIGLAGIEGRREIRIRRQGPLRYVRFPGGTVLGRMLTWHIRPGAVRGHRLEGGRFVLELNPKVDVEVRNVSGFIADMERWMRIHRAYRIRRSVRRFRRHTSSRSS